MLRHRRSKFPHLSVLVLACLIIASGPAQARNEPIATLPAPGSRITTQPDAVTVALDQPVKPPYVMVVKRSTGELVSTGEPSVLSTNIALQLPTGLPDDVYQVEFRSEGASGPEGGSFQFVLGQAGAVDYSGIRTWGGYTKVPRSLALPGDAAAAAAATATPTPTPTDDSSESADPTAGGGDDATDDTSDSDDSSRLPWIVAGAVALAAAAAALVIVARRRSRQSDDV